MPGVPFNPAAPTTLVTRSAGATTQFYELTGTAFGGSLRTRSVYVSQVPDFIVVLGRASGASE